jgi:hypothetical protein
MREVELKYLKQIEELNSRQTRAEETRQAKERDLNRQLQEAKSEIDNLQQQNQRLQQKVSAL